MTSSVPAAHSEFHSSEGVPCAAIDLTFPSGAKGEQLIRIHYDTQGSHSALENRLLSAFREFKPVVVACGEMLGVIKDGEQSGVVLPPEPVHRGVLHSENSSPEQAGNSIRILREDVA